MFILHKHLLIFLIRLKDNEMNSLPFNQINNFVHVKIDRLGIGTLESIFLYTNSDQIGSCMPFTIIPEYGHTINQLIPNFVNTKDKSMICGLNIDHIYGIASAGGMKI